MSLRAGIYPTIRIVDCKVSTVTCAKTFRVSRRSIAGDDGGDRARRRAIYSLIYYFSCGPSPHRYTRNFAGEFPVGLVSVSTVKFRSQGQEWQFGNSGGAYGGWRQTGRHNCIASGNLWSYEGDNANWQSLDNDNTSLVARSKLKDHSEMMMTQRGCGVKDVTPVYHARLSYTFLVALINCLYVKGNIS